MQTPNESKAFERAVQPLFDLLFPEFAEQVAAFRVDLALADRIEKLATKCTDGDLTEAERAEYTGYVRANKFVAILQNRARQILASRN